MRHADELAPNLREGDMLEGKALGLEPLTALRESLANSEVSWAFLLDGEVAALFGVLPVPHSPGCGWVWMLSGRACDKHKRAFLRAGREVVPALLEHYSILCNAIDARYTGALRWARWMGFTVRDAVPLGPHGLPFHPFMIRRP
jgi:hypothetical protein